MLAGAFGGERATTAPLSRLSQTFRSGSPSFMHARISSNSVVCRRSCKMSPMFPDASPSKTGSALPTCRGESRLLSSCRSFTTAFLRSPLMHCAWRGTGGGRYAEYARTLREPVLAGHPDFAGLPLGPQHTGMGHMYPCEGTHLSGLTPSPAPPCAGVEPRR